MARGLLFQSEETGWLVDCCFRAKRLVGSWTVVSVSYFYKNPSKHVGQVQSNEFCAIIFVLVDKIKIEIYNGGCVLIYF